MFAIKSAIKNWERIRIGKINDILKSNHTTALTDNLPWITHIKSVLRQHNININNTNLARPRKHPHIHKIFHAKQVDEFHQNAFETMEKPESKLRTYSLFKKEIGCEKYLLEINNIEIRQSFTKFRLSNHTLNIEKGRHTSPKTPKEERFCPFCPTKVEDEKHFLLECPTYLIPRNVLIENIVKDNPNFISQKSKFLQLMSPENAYMVAKTIHNLFEIRNFIINKPRMLI